MKRRGIIGSLFGLSVQAAVPADNLPVGGAHQARYERTAAEIDARIIPTSYAVAGGPLRYGARGDDRTDDSAAWNAMGRVGGYHFVPNGTYTIGSKVQTSNVTTLVGETRQSTNIKATGFADFVVEIGASETGPNPNVGSLQRLRFVNGAPQNRGMLHMNTRSHLWRLDELLFQSCACPALVVTDCWDSYYTNIDIYSCGPPNQPANIGAAVQILQNSAGEGSNNIYFRGLHIEGCPSGCLYIAPGIAPIFVSTGKIDQGFIKQYSAAVTVAGTGISSSTLVMDNYTLSGVRDQYVFAVSGNLILNNVLLGGGTGMAALIWDERGWGHVNYLTYPGAANASYGPGIGQLSLNNVNASATQVSSLATTPAVIQSKIPLARSALALRVSDSSPASATTCNIVTTLTAAHNGLYNGYYLVHNPTGTLCGPTSKGGSAANGSRRRIIQSYSTGQLLLAGGWNCTLDADWSLEFCAGHYTPNLSVSGLILAQGQSLFAILHTGAKLSGVAVYQPAGRSGGLQGCTHCVIVAAGLTDDFDCRGYYLVDEATGEPFLIDYGNHGGVIAVPYDRTLVLNDAIAHKHSFSIVAGYFLNVQQNGSSYEWTFAGRKMSALISAVHAAGFDLANFPLWGFGDEVGAASAARRNEFMLSIDHGGAVPIVPPDNLQSGDRVLCIISNVSGSTLGPLRWDSRFKMAEWASPAVGFSRSIEFRFNGTLLIEISRTPYDVPI